MSAGNPSLLDRKRKGRIHFVGIGGVGMSGIAKVLLNLGYRVGGSDAKLTELTRRLADAGARIFGGHKASHVKGVQVVVISSAVRGNNPEVAAARTRGIPVIRRAEMLAELARLKKTVTVSGSHGKTTTTAMAAMALAGAGADPTMIIGGQLKNIDSNARLGMGDYLVAEADESDGSFQLLSPLVAIVTNIDNDHMDYYKNMANLKAAFLRHLRRVPPHGAAVLCADDPALAVIGRRLECAVLRYGFRAGAEWTARRVRISAQGSSFDLTRGGRVVAEVRLGVPGRHNVLNALAAIAAGSFLDFPLKKLIAGLEKFKGVGRRMERLGEAGGVIFLDDYGHHPTEIRATLEAVSEVYRGRLIALFQPHRYSRTQLLRRDFGPAFRRADAVYVTEIYPAGERPIPGVSSRLVLDSLRKSRVPGFAFTRAVDLARELKPGDVLLTIGAGDVWKIGEDLRRRLSDGTFAAY